MADNPLGQAVSYPKHYNPSILMAIARSENRNKLNIVASALPFKGADVWNAYELSWLDLKGKPRAALARIIIPCDSNSIVESKSLKLYFNSLNQESYQSLESVRNIIQQDLSTLLETTVDVQLMSLLHQGMVIEAPDGICLDELDVEVTHYHPHLESLTLENTDQAFDELVDEVLYTNLFKSNCPITEQPDWATVTVCYRGKKICHEGLLKYLLSYREHNDYHENCVEAIFQAIQIQCNPQALSVEANFLRRGGIDINPIRTTEENLNYQNFPRFIRQ